MAEEHARIRVDQRQVNNYCNSMPAVKDVSCEQEVAHMVSDTDSGGLNETVYICAEVDPSVQDDIVDVLCARRRSERVVWSEKQLGNGVIEVGRQEKADWMASGLKQSGCIGEYDAFLVTKKRMVPGSV